MERSGQRQPGDPQCWQCEHAQRGLYGPTCARGREITAALLISECPSFAPRQSWGYACCPLCFLDGVLRPCCDAQGQVWAVCTNNPAHRWPLHVPGPRRETGSIANRCVCGALYLVFTYDPASSPSVRLAYRICPNPGCGAGEIRGGKRPAYRVAGRRITSTQGVRP